MKVVTRVIFSFIMIIFIAVCAYVFCLSSGIISEYDIGLFTMNRKYLELYQRYIICVICVILAVTAFCLLFFRKSKKEKLSNSVVLSVAEGSSISVTTEAIKELAHNYLSGIQGINTENVSIRPVSEKNIDINTSVSVQNEIQIPQITQKISEEMKSYVELYSGAVVRNVNINVKPTRTAAGAAKKV